MPTDIRSFFGIKPSQSSQVSAPAEDLDSKKPKGRKSKKTAVIEDSDDDLVPTKRTPKKASSKKNEKQPTPKKAEPTTASDYFVTSNRPKRSEPAKVKAVPKDSTSSSKTASPSSTIKAAAANGRKQSSSRSKPKPDYDLEDLDRDDDIFAADYKTTRGKGDDYEEVTDAEDEPVQSKKSSRASAKKPSKSTKTEKDYVPEHDDIDMDDFVVPDDDDDDDDFVKRPSKKKSLASSKKRKSDEIEVDDDDVDDDKAEPIPKKGKVQSTTSTPKKPKKQDVPESSQMQEILDSIPLIRPPTPPPKDKDGKYNFNANNSNLAVPAGAGSKEVPTGADNCLVGLSFVFTGILETISREDGQALVKRYGGKVMTAPSSKTSYVVLGSDAGPSKLKKIKDHELKTINEDGLFELIRRLPPNGGDSKAAAAFEERQQKEVEAAKQMAVEMEKQERQERQVQKDKKLATANGKASHTLPTTRTSSAVSASSKLWTVKYAPSQLNQICGNKSQVDKLQNWLRNFPKSLRTNFKLAGKDGTGIYRAVIIHGPPGIGKTTAAHLVAKLEGYDVVESNASDTRSKRMVEDGLRSVLDTTSLMGYFAGGDGTRIQNSKRKLVLIMDEVDGMSAGDRGGVGALAAICKKSRIPIILICNDRKLQKMKPFDYCTYDMPFRRPTTDQIRSRIMTIAYRENLKMPPNVINALIEGSGADIRQVVNMISTARLDEEALDFDKGKQMSKAWMKHAILKPWDITSKILGGGMFAESNNSTLNDKIELYFNDHEFSYLMLEENYLGTNPTRAGTSHGRERSLKVLDLVEKAAASISDGDLVDRMIHGSQQQWSLMPTHAVFSFVRPASFVAGSMAGHQTRFTSWLGKNSSQGKMSRMVKEIQGHMRLRSSGDRHEIRQQYVPALWNRLIKRLEVEGKEAAPEIIDLMDSYFLTKEDFDAINELGVGPMDMEKVKIDSQAKSTFTRLYNQASHPLPFMKASTVFAPKKPTKDKPDLEEAIEESDEGEVVEEGKDEFDEDQTDLSKDKYIKAPKKTPAWKGAGKGAAGKGAGKKRARDSADEGESDAKRGKASGSKGKASAKGKGAKK